MKKQVTPYHVVDLSPGRRAWLNVLDLPGRRLACTVCSK